MTARRRRSPNREPDIKEQILLAAGKLIVERGLASMSLADIASEAEVSKGTLYYYFPTKSSLIFEISRRHMDAVSAKLFRWVEATGGGVPPDVILRRVVHTLINSKTQGLTHLYLVQAAVSGDESIRAGFVDAYRGWRNLIERGLERIVPERAGSSNSVAAIVLAAIDGLLLQTLLGVEKIDLEDVARRLTHMAYPPDAQAQ